MTRENKRCLGFAAGAALLVSGIGVLTAGASSAGPGPRSPAPESDCAVERAALELAESALERELAAEGEGPVAELVSARDVAFANYCDCAGLSVAPPLEPRAPIFTPGRRGTPPFASTPGVPVFTPPGPPPGRPPVTLPPVTRGRPAFTPPGPPFTPPGMRQTPTPTLTFTTTPTGTPNIQPEGRLPGR